MRSRSFCFVKIFEPATPAPSRRIICLCTTKPLPLAAIRRTVFSRAQHKRSPWGPHVDRRRNKCCTYSAGDTSRGRSSNMSAMPIGNNNGKDFAKRPGARIPVGSSWRLGYPYANASAIPWASASSATRFLRFSIVPPDPVSFSK